ncbi:aminotransferase class IV [Allomuricauda sp. F6463D]|uniref:aminotransferase class IV n=1 Tax=Allomuricauda sp. F6463D TaxID=2926409 RepID=UPI001FF68083|nr:aminotransferase class IV [Muricauda sp. F6463D]MCK0159274.1 aminotransferase class IV [Muricauda sp. F6463D]
MLPKGNFPKKVYLNGEIISSDDAKISVFDRGFLFGDGIYEVMMQLEHGIFYKKAHLDRLQDNLGKIGIEYDVKEIDTRIVDLLSASNLEGTSCLIYMQVTRGVAPRKHGYPKGVPPTVMMYALPYSLPSINLNSMKAVLETDFRWHRCDIKSVSLLGNIMTNETAMNAHTDEAALVRDGFVTEGSHTNIFFVKNDTIITHPADEHILNGITRKIVLKLCNDLGIPVIEKPVAQNEIATMDEAFFTGTTTQVASISQLGTHVFYQKNDIGNLTKRLQNAFAELRSIDSSLAIV